MGVENYTGCSFDGLVTVPACNATVEYWHDAGFTPNGVTFLHIAIKVVVLYLITLKEIPALPVAALISLIAYLDAMDGIMARKYDQGSSTGAMLDAGSDFVFWITFGLVILLRLKGPLKFVLLIVMLIVALSITVMFFDECAGEKKEEPGLKEYIWSAASWNIVPLAFIIGIPILKSI